MCAYTYILKVMICIYFIYVFVCMYASIFMYSYIEQLCPVLHLYKKYERFHGSNNVQLF